MSSGWCSAHLLPGDALGTNRHNHNVREPLQDLQGPPRRFLKLLPPPFTRWWCLQWCNKYKPPTNAATASSMGWWRLIWTHEEPKCSSWIILNHLTSKFQVKVWCQHVNWSGVILGKLLPPSPVWPHIRSVPKCSMHRQPSLCLGPWREHVYKLLNVHLRC